VSFQSRAGRAATEFNIFHAPPKIQERGAGLALIFLDLHVRQPVRVLRCALRAEGIIFMVNWNRGVLGPGFVEAFQKSQVNQANCQHLNPNISTEYESSHVSGAGEALRTVMAT